MTKLIIYCLLASLASLLVLPVNVFATGIRYDTGEDATAEESHCWVDGYDSGFAGKYDEDRA